MSVQVFPSLASERSIPLQKDRVVAAFPLPAGARLHKLWLSQSVIARSMSYIHAVLYGVDGFILPMLDPDTPITPDTMWNAQVPKDDAVGSDVIDLDTLPAGGDADPVFEPGDPSISDLLQMTTSPTEVSPL